MNSDIYKQPNGKYAVKVDEHYWIPMPDGVRLSARIWRPCGNGPFPAILEYIPYRKRDLVRARDERNHPYFAAHGYVCLRVDMRGSGDSEGHMPDMYSEDELADVRHLIDWIASQEWCSGRVGMFGTSWGGTASLQAAVNAPGPLKAVIANCATINRFEDDIHWMGGLLLTDSFEWGATLPAILAAPPDASTVGDGWFDMWKERLEKLSFPIENWVNHRTLDDYWRHGSVAFNSEQLSCPILTIGGWSDRYSNTVMDLVSLRSDICWGVVGPWGHHYPDQGEPGPAIGFQDLALKWWDHWLKDDSEKELNWPRLRLWQREFDPPQDRLEVRNGDWIEVNNLESTKSITFYLTPDSLSLKPDSKDASLEVPVNLSHGDASGDTGYFGRVGGLPLDQSVDDNRALCFDSEPLEEDLILIGHAELTVDIAPNGQCPQLVCRICEVDCDGRSNLVVRQVRNLALDETFESTVPFERNKPVPYRIRMPSTAYRFTQGNRIRLAIGSSYLPLVWHTVWTSQPILELNHAQLVLPRLVPTVPLSIPFPTPKKLPVQQSWVFRTKGPIQRKPRKLVKDYQYERSDYPGDEFRFTVYEKQYESSWRLPRIKFNFKDINVEISTETSTRHILHTKYFGSNRYEICHVIEIRRADGTARIECNLFATCNDERGLHVRVELTATWNGEPVSYTGCNFYIWEFAERLSVD